MWELQISVINGQNKFGLEWKVYQFPVTNLHLLNRVNLVFCS